MYKIQQGKVTVTIGKVGAIMKSSRLPSLLLFQSVIGLEICTFFSAITISIEKNHFFTLENRSEDPNLESRRDVELVGIHKCINFATVSEEELVSAML